MRLDLFVKSCTVILLVGIRYFMRDLLSDLTNMPDPRYASDTVNDVSAYSGISLL